jgi:hypothetical protein
MVLNLLALLVPKYKYCAACVLRRIMRRFGIVMLNVRFCVYSHTLGNLLPTAQRIFRKKGALLDVYMIQDCYDILSENCPRHSASFVKGALY